ncbi:MAG: competence protein TfoX [Erysipelotrichia bacterium]|nr:competence protein TfoX [Erysipelotrichia bacterium]
MATSKEYLNFISEQFSELDEVSFRPMMGEYLMYFRGRLAGGIYDDTLLVKTVDSAVEYMPDALSVIPYPGAKAMLAVDNVDSREYLMGLIQTMYEDLPESKSKRNR